MLPTSLCRHTRHHQTRLALYSSQAHSGIVSLSASSEQLTTHVYRVRIPIGDSISSVGSANLNFFLKKVRFEKKRILNK